MLMTPLMFCCFERFLAYTLFLPSFIVVGQQIAELSLGGAAFLSLPFHYRGIPDPVQNRVKADFLSSQKLLVAMLLQKKSIMQVLAVNMLMRICIVKIVCECFLP